MKLIDGMDESLKTDSVEFKFKTGRTTRMMQEVIELAKTGKPIVVLMKDEFTCAKWRAAIGNVAGVAIEPMHLEPTTEVDWKEMKLVGTRANHALFIDHSVFESTFRHILKAWSKYDLHMDRTPYLHKAV